MRLGLAEQTYGAVGLSPAADNDQLRTLFAIVVLAMVAGWSRRRHGREAPAYQVVATCPPSPAPGWKPSRLNLTRPPQLYLSQALIGLGTTLFIGPTLVFGMLRVLRRGADVLVSLIVPLSVTQNIGGLAGSALLGTVQTVSAHAHAAALSEQLSGADPQVLARLQGGAAALSGAVVDPAARSAGGAALLGQALNREAAVLAFNDTFTLVVGLALATALFIAVNLLYRRWRTPSEPGS